MRHWSLGAKLTAWSALVVGLALTICSVGAVLFIQDEQVEALDDQLRSEAHTFFGEVSRHGASLDWKNRAEIKAILPITRTKRFIQILDGNGTPLYQSGKVKSVSVGGPGPGSRTLKIEGRTIRIGVFQQRALTLYLGAELNEINADQTHLLVGLFIGLPLLVTVVAGGGWWLAKKALAPIRDITAATEQITVACLNQRLPMLWARDEIGRLTDVLNAMFDRLDLSFRQAMRFSADASHELKTPLAVLRSGIEDLLQSPALSESDQRAVSALLEQTRHLSSITASLLLLSRADAGRLKLDRTEVDLCEVIVGCADDAAIMAESRRIGIETTLPARLCAYVEAGRLMQILLNLLDNAVKFNRDGGRVTIVAELFEEQEIVIRIANTGPGITPDQAPLIFERFFRLAADLDKPGHGLGLSLARELARAHDGELSLESSDANWTVFKLRLPGRAGGLPTV